MPQCFAVLSGLVLSRVLDILVGFIVWRGLHCFALN